MIERRRVGHGRHCCRSAKCSCYSSNEQGPPAATPTVAKVIPIQDLVGAP